MNLTTSLNDNWLAEWNEGLRVLAYLQGASKDITDLSIGNSSKSSMIMSVWPKTLWTLWDHMIVMASEITTNCLFNSLHRLTTNNASKRSAWGESTMTGRFPSQMASRGEKVSIPWCHYIILTSALQWRHNEHDAVSNHKPQDCVLKRLFRRRSKKTSKLLVTGLCVGNSPVAGEFPAQKASNAENVSIWWCHHGTKQHLLSVILRKFTL